MGEPQRDRSVVRHGAADGRSWSLDVWSTGKARVRPHPPPAVLVVHGGVVARQPRHDARLEPLAERPSTTRCSGRAPPALAGAVALDEVAWTSSRPPRVGALAHAAEHAWTGTASVMMGVSAGANLDAGAYSMGDPRLPPSTSSPRQLSVVNPMAPRTWNRLSHHVRSGYVRPLMDGYVGGSPDAFPDRYRLPPRH
jgi:hypothetical protein